MYRVVSDHKYYLFAGSALCEHAFQNLIIIIFVFFFQIWSSYDMRWLDMTFFADIDLNFDTCLVYMDV
jgi:hypothetical protein